MRKFAFILMLPLLFFSGCFYDSDNKDSGNMLKVFKGIKAVSYNQNYTLDQTLNQYSTFIIEQMFANFGILNCAECVSVLENPPDAENYLNFDRIRVQTNTSGDNDIISWLWTFNPETDGLEYPAEPMDRVSHYRLSALQEQYYQIFVEPYSAALEIVIMQIILEQTPTIFTVDLNDNKVYADSAKTIEIAPECEYLLQMRQTFTDSARYVGLTVENVATLKTYILNEVIGDQLVGSIYDEIWLENSTTTYTQIISQLLTLEPEFAKSIYEPYPISSVRDYHGGDLYTKGGDDSLEHIPAAEWQSFVIMTAEETRVLTIFLDLWAETDLDLTFSINYYSAAAQSKTTVKQVNHSIKAGKNGMCMLDFKAVKLKEWNNPTGLSDQANGMEISNQTGLSKYFTVQNGVGVIDSSLINQDYLEIVINKAVPGGYQPFKLGFMNIITYKY